MSAEERVYTINLGKVMLSQSQHRSVRAINMIREFASKHMGGSDVKIDEDVAHQIWARGVRRPPRKIRVRMWEGDSGEIIVSKYEGEDVALEMTPAEPKAAQSAQDEAAEAEAAEPGAEAEPEKAGQDTKEAEVAEPAGPDTKEAEAAEPGAEAEPEKADPQEQGKKD